MSRDVYLGVYCTYIMKYQPPEVNRVNIGEEKGREFTVYSRSRYYTPIIITLLFLGWATRVRDIAMFD